MAFYPQGMTLKALLENPDLLNPPKLTGGNKEKKEKDPDDLDMIFNPQSAFLGPQLWDKTLPYDSNDLKLEYMDLDEFLEENGIPLTEDQSKSNLENARVPHPMLSQSPPQLLGVEGVAVNPRTLSPHPDAYDTSNISALLVGNNDKCESNKAKGEESSLIETVGSTRLNSASRENQSSPVVELNISAMDLALAQIPDLDSEIVSPSLSVSPQSDSNSQDFQLNPDDLALARVEGQEDFDPRERKFSEEELRPQPMIKKAKKIFIDDEAKDDKYWMRRKKNNVAAKRSRDARRIKENQIAMRASFLENQANQLRKELAKSKEENCELRKRLAKYE